MSDYLQWSLRVSIASLYNGLFFVLYGSVVPGCSADAPGNVELFHHCFGVFRRSAGVPYSVVPCSGVPGFIVCHKKIILSNNRF